MAYRLSWLIPERVILVQLSGVIDEASVLECDGHLVRMLEEADSGTAQVHQIMMFGRDIERTPNTGVYTRLSAPQHPRNGWLIAVGTTKPVMKLIGSLAAQLIRMRARRMDTMFEALDFLYKMDSTMPKKQNV